MVDTQESWHFVSFFALKPEAQAAWVQAVGSLIALVIAVGIPAAQAVSASRKVRLRAKSLATMVMVEVRAIRESFDGLLQQSELNENDLANGGIKALLTLPEGLAQARSALHDMDIAAEPLIGLVAEMQMTHTLWSAWKYEISLPPDYRDEAVDVELLRQGIRRIPDLAADSLNAISRLLRRP